MNKQIMLNEQIKNKNVVKYLFIVTILVFMAPSILYFLRGNKLFDVNTEYNYLLLPGKIKWLNTVSFGSMFLIIGLLYFEIIKKTNELFKTKKQLIIFILIISIMFAIVLPFTSTDIYYYMSTGWSEAKYGVNPYYIPVQQVIDTKLQEGEIDQLLQKVPHVWRNQTIVYGPLWPLICRILTTISAGNLEICLGIFKLLNLLIHMLNCYIIYKITNRKKFVAIYGLNPFVLFEFLSNVHNDIIVVFFMLLAIYFVRKKHKIIPAICTLALATAIKYYAILLTPFFVIYHFRNEKLKKKIPCTIGLAILFILIVMAFYLLYVKDIYVLRGISIQQNKLANSLYLLIGMYPTLSLTRAVNVANIATIVFLVIYMIVIPKKFFGKQEDITFIKCMRIYNTLLLIFLVFVITGFQTWYIMWIMPTMFFMKGKNIKRFLQLSIVIELALLPFFAINSHYSNGKWFLLLMYGIMGLLIICPKIKRRLMLKWQN